MEVVKKAIIGNDILQVIRVRPFLLMIVSQFFSQLAFNMQNFVLILIVFGLTRSSVSVSGLILSFTIPAVLLSVISGVQVDRWDKRKILFFCQSDSGNIDPAPYDCRSSCWIYLCYYVFCSNCDSVFSSSILRYSSKPSSKKSHNISKLNFVYGYIRKYVFGIYSCGTFFAFVWKRIYYNVHCFPFFARNFFYFSFKTFLSFC